MKDSEYNNAILTGTSYILIALTLTTFGLWKSGFFGWVADSTRVFCDVFERLWFAYPESSPKVVAVLVVSIGFGVYGFFKELLWS